MEQPLNLLELSSADEIVNFGEMQKVLSEFANQIFATANENHHYDSQPDIAPLLMHIVSETAEASDAILTQRFAHEPVLDLLSKHFHIDTFEKTVKNTGGDELADIIILALSIAKYKKIPIEKHIILKMMYNQYRNTHSITTHAYSDANK
jgi:NTP pyrophosphatase (non-canonical NTP hydrolase)